MPDFLVRLEVAVCVSARNEFAARHYAADNWIHCLAEGRGEDGDRWAARGQPPGVLLSCTELAVPAARPDPPIPKPPPSRRPARQEEIF